mmetsp:Transcript_16955/g.46700  ORF Transcript_16955/g.46700 Transcript_16955/m.46700 type:complete len:271 (-) Transcript_16955:355-1167(-)
MEVLAALAGLRRPGGRGARADPRGPVLRGGGGRDSLEHALEGALAAAPSPRREHAAVAAAVHGRERDPQLRPRDLPKRRRASLGPAVRRGHQCIQPRGDLRHDAGHRPVGPASAAAARGCQHAGLHVVVGRPRARPGRGRAGSCESCHSRLGAAVQRVPLHGRIRPGLGRRAVGLPQRDLPHGRQGAGLVDLCVLAVGGQLPRGLPGAAAGAVPEGGRHVCLLLGLPGRVSRAGLLLRAGDKGPHPGGDGPPLRRTRHRPRAFRGVRNRF